MTSRYVIHLRDRNRVRVGRIDRYDRANFLLRFNAPGTWEIELAPHSALAAQIDWGWGIVVEREGRVLFSGPIRRRRRRLTPRGRQDTLYGYNDAIVLAERLAKPVPGGPPYTAAAHDVFTGGQEAAMRYYVDRNAGAAVAALGRPDRRVPGLVLEPGGTRGGARTVRARFQTLQEILEGMAGTTLGFTVIQDGPGTDLVFRVYEPANRTASTIFAFERGNLAAVEYDAAAPAANMVTVAGGQELTNREFEEGGDLHAIVRHNALIEGFADARDTVDHVELRERLDRALADGAEKTTLRLSPLDTDALAFGVARPGGDAYQLGDRVAVWLDGQPIVDVLREVDLTLNGDGETVEPGFGTPSAAGVWGLFALARDLVRRVSHLERR